MRAYVLIVALLAASPASAGTYLLVCGAGGCAAPDDTQQPPGTAINRIVWDRVTRYDPPAGTVLIPDDGRSIYAPWQP